MVMWKNEDEMFALMREKLYTPVIGDILDQNGFVHQFLPPDIRPLSGNMKIAGKAMTVLMIDVYGEQNKPFGYLTEALDQLEKNEIYLATGGTKTLCVLGRTADGDSKEERQPQALSLNGWHRDTPQVLEQNWPVFSCGCYAQDSSVRTQVVQYRCQIEIGQVTVQDGDIVFWRY